jgi:hypothetical protein
MKKNKKLSPKNNFLCKKKIKILSPRYNTIEQLVLSKYLVRLVQKSSICLNFLISLITIGFCTLH